MLSLILKSEMSGTCELPVASERTLPRRGKGRLHVCHEYLPVGRSEQHVCFQGAVFQKATKPDVTTWVSASFFSQCVFPVSALLLVTRHILQNSLTPCLQESAALRDSNLCWNHAKNDRGIAKAQCDFCFRHPSSSNEADCRRPVRSPQQHLTFILRQYLMGLTQRARHGHQRWSSIFLHMISF